MPLCPHLVAAVTEQEALFEQEAIKFAKANRNAIARRIADIAIFPGEEHPVSVFMSGSPGAGKTEASLELIKALGTVLRIDPDELRSEFPAYNGANSWLLQRAVTPIVERIHDLALKQKQSFLLDGTLANFDIAERNIQRSLDRNRLVQILFVYQEPQFAWRFVQAREKKEGRNIPPEQFVNQYFAARSVANRLKEKFGQGVKIDVLLKNIDGSHRTYQANVDQIDGFIPEKFTRDQVLKLVS